MLSVAYFVEEHSWESLSESLPRLWSIQGRFFGNDPLQMVLYW